MSSPAALFNRRAFGSENLSPTPQIDSCNSICHERKSGALFDHLVDERQLFVHGSTCPAETAFDLRLDGLSWMDFIAGHGSDVYLADVGGYLEAPAGNGTAGASERTDRLGRCRDVGSAVFW